MIRVTEILDYHTPPELLGWMLRFSKAKRKAISEESIEIGNKVDELVQLDIKDGGYLVDAEREEVQNCMQAWELFKSEHKYDLSWATELQKELTMDDVVGHPDIIHVEPNRWGIIDIKSSKAIYSKYWLQVAKYSQMEKYMSNRPDPDFIAILRLDKATGRYEYREMNIKTQIDYHISVFSCYLACYKHSQETREILRMQLEDELLKEE